ncbi:hypothetical protein CANARDRAFT_187107, partial [[Candida] arabinofermentans NRRL YB-2248]
IPSPILNKELRIIQNETVGDDNSKKFLNRELFNDIEFVEINNIGPSSKVSKLQNVESITIGDDDTIKQPSDFGCHMYIYVKSKNSEMLEVSNNYPLLNIINEESQDIGSNFKTSIDSNSTVINLNKFNKANELISNSSSSNITEYLTLIKESKINSFLFTLNKETSGYKPIILLVESLLQDMKFNLKNKSNKNHFEKESNSLKIQINQWSQLSHFELQSKIIPFLTDILIMKFSKISQILFNVDDFQLVLSKHLFEDELNIQKSTFNFTKVKCHGSLIDSTNKLNYLEGKIDSLLPQDDELQTDNIITNPITQLKQLTNDVKLPELEAKINKITLDNLILINLPTFSITTIGYILNYLELNSTMALIALSLAISFNNISKSSYSLLNNFKDWYIENLRLSIDKNTIYLNNKLSENLKKVESNIDKRLKNFENLSKEVEK